jgi:hypothetical protein
LSDETTIQNIGKRVGTRKITTSAIFSARNLRCRAVRLKPRRVGTEGVATTISYPVPLFSVERT